MKRTLAPVGIVTLSLFLLAWSVAQTPPPAQGPPPKQATTPNRAAPAAAKPPWEAFKLNPKTTMFLDFTDSNPDMIISIFSGTSGITIINDPTFKTPLTVTSAKAVGLKEAFEIFNTVLGLSGYELQKKGNMLLLAKKQPPMGQPSPPAPPPPVPIIKTYPLENANATQVARVINEVFGAAVPSTGGSSQPGGPGGPFGEGPIQILGGGRPGVGTGGGPGGAKPPTVKASAEDYSNSVVVSALPNDQTTVEKLIKDLDKTTAQPLESELFHLKYVPAEEVLPAIEDVLTSNAPVGRGAAKSQNQGRSDYYYGYSPFGGGGNSQRTAGGQTATAIKQTNSVIVNALKANLVLIRKLLANMDQPSSFVGTTTVVRLQNAKATDVADLLTKVFAQKTNSQDNNPFFFYSDFYDPNRNKDKKDTDINEHGEIVNVRDINGKISIIADPNTNSLVIVTLPSNMKTIRDVIDKLDQVAEQVMIETVIVEANLDKTMKLGVEWSFLNNKLFNNPGASGTGSTNFGLQTATPPLEGLKYTITHSDYTTFLNALQTDTRFKVLDTPKIFTSNNVKAEINVSQKFPYITSQQTGSAGNLLTTYQFQDVGVILTVTPRITSSGQVTMEVVQAADDLQGFTSFNAPIINHRQASTTVSVGDGETIVLGGIIRHTLNQVEKKIPILGDIPLFGNLFRSSSRSGGQTELMVFLTPHIVRSTAEAQRIRKEETDRLSKQSQDSVKKVIPPPPPAGVR